ncbi:sulfate transporter isoform X1 [Scleropages formosus]|nr:sulfate transporter isoform X1 [Scleropages formosus]
MFCTVGPLSKAEVVQLHADFPQPTETLRSSAAVSVSTTGSLSGTEGRPAVSAGFWENPLFRREKHVVVDRNPSVPQHLGRSLPARAEVAKMADEDQDGVAEDDLTTVEPHVPFVLEAWEKEEESWRMLVSRKLRKQCACSSARTKGLLLGFFPVLSWLPRYRFREWLLGDVMSGVIVGILLVPQSIAYSLLAGQDPIYGLYTSFFAGIIYMVLGTSRHVSVGIFGVLCLLVGQVVDRELDAAGFNVSAPSGNLTAGLACDRSCYSIIVGATVTFMAGIFQVLMGLLQVGFVSVFLSDALLSGFATGASLTILTSQVKYLLGLNLPRAQSPGSLIKTWVLLAQNIGQTNICDLVTSLLCMLVLVPAKELNDRFKAKLRAPIPFELFVVIAATLASHFGHFEERFGSSVAGNIPTGFMPPQLPAWSLIPNVAMDALSMAIIGFVITVSLSEMFAKKHGYTVVANQEMYAIGFCNILSSFFRCFTTSAALTKTLVKESTGCQTQLSSLVTALVLLLVLLVIAPLFYSLQKCVLAVIIVVNLRGALTKICEVPQMWRVNHVDTATWLITMGTSALVNTELGLVVGVLVSAFCVLGRTQRAPAVQLGQADLPELYEDLASYKGLHTHRGVVVFRYEAPIYYANQVLFKRMLYRRVGLDPLVEKARRMKQEKQDRKRDMLKPSAGKKEVPTCVFLPQHTSFHTLVLDCAPVLFLDTAGVNALKEVAKDYNELGIRLVLARCSASVLDSLRRGGYLDAEAEGPPKVFFTIGDAVQYAQSLASQNGNCEASC